MQQWCTIKDVCQVLRRNQWYISENVFIIIWNDCRIVFMILKSANLPEGIYILRLYTITMHVIYNSFLQFKLQMASFWPSLLNRFLLKFEVYYMNIS